MFISNRVRTHVAPTRYNECTSSCATSRNRKKENSSKYPKRKKKHHRDTLKLLSKSTGNEAKRIKRGPTLLVSTRHCGKKGEERERERKRRREVKGSRSNKKKRSADPRPTNRLLCRLFFPLISSRKRPLQNRCIFHWWRDARPVQSCQRGWENGSPGPPLDLPLLLFLSPSHLSTQPQVRLG